jgi:hypothetical protein
MNGGERGTVLVVDDGPVIAGGHVADLRDRCSLQLTGCVDTALETLSAAIDVVLVDADTAGSRAGTIAKRVERRGFECQTACLAPLDRSVPDRSAFDAVLRYPLSSQGLTSRLERLLTRADCDQQLGRYYAVTAHVASLEAELVDAPLHDQGKYVEKRRERREIRASLDQAMAELPDRELFDIAASTGAGTSAFGRA